MKGIMSGHEAIMKTDVALRESEQRSRRIAEKPRPDETTQESGTALTTLDTTESKRSNETTSNLAAIVESSDDAIVGKTLDGVITTWNRGAEELYGYSAEEAKGKSISILIPPNRPNELPQILDRIKRGEKVQHYETECMRKDGKIVAVSLTVSPIRNPTGAIIGASTIARDITERKQVEEALRLSEAKFRALFENTPDLIFMIGEKDEIISINPAAARMLGKTVEQVLGRSLFDVYPKEIATMFSENVRAVLQTGKSRNIDEKIVLAGNERWINTRLQPLLDDTGRTYAVTGVARDITERVRVEEKLRQSEENYHSLFDQMLDGVYRSTHEGRFVDVNPAFVKMFGYSSKQEMLNIADIKKELYFSPEDRVSHDLYPGDKENVETYCMRRKDGSEIWVEDHGHYVHDEQGNITYHEGILRDVTERKRLEEELSRSSQFFGSVVENAYVWLNVLDNEQNVLVWNKAAEIMSGYSQEEVVGHGKVWEWLYPDQEYRKQTIQTVNDVLQSGRTDVDSETKIKRKDGQTRIISWNERALTDQDGKAIGTIAIGHDITERKQVERLKDEFVSTVSHELRTPLTAIRASLGLLAGGVSGTLPEKGQRMVEIAVTNTDRLVRLINDILDSDRLASGKIPIERKQCSAAQLVTQVVDNMKPVAEKEGISFFVKSQDAPLWADPDRISQALTNLLSNAIKFSPKGGRIWVTAERKENQMVFKVRDEGRGIPPEKLGLLFERFHQVDASDAREKGGSGLGLSISKSIVEQHHGKIWVESTVGKGSTFLFTIPLPLEEAPLKPEAATGAPSTRKALIIEDDSDLANILAAMLERHDIQPHIALTGGRGIALSKQIQPDLIVLDLILPDMDGSMVVEGLRKDNVLRSVPLVVYTVKELDKQQRENLRLGETLFFTKSRIPPDQFEEKVVQFMKRILENRGTANVS
jgi:PAS domain S-box-containing protein